MTIIKGKAALAKFLQGFPQGATFTATHDFDMLQGNRATKETILYQGKPIMEILIATNGSCSEVRALQGK